MDLYSAIKQIYPELDDNTFVLKNDGNGSETYILKWDNELPQPTKEELEAAWLEVIVPPDPLKQPSEVDKLKEENVKLKEELGMVKQEFEAVKQESQMNALAIFDLAEMLL